MTCEEFSERISNYIEGELGGDGRAAMDGHAADCPACAQALEKTGFLTDRLSRLTRVHPSVGFDFALRSRLLMEVSEANQWRRRLQNLLFPSIPRALVSGMAVALLALGVSTVLNERPNEIPVAWKIPESGRVMKQAGAFSAHSMTNGRGALKQVSYDEAPHSVSRSSLQFYASQADTLKPAARRPVRQRGSGSGVRRVSVRF